MEEHDALFVTFSDVRDCTFLTSGQPYQRVRFRTLPGLHYDPLKGALTRLVGEVPDNLTWDAESGEGAFVLMANEVTPDTYRLPYAPAAPERDRALLEIVQGDNPRGSAVKRSEVLLCEAGLARRACSSFKEHASALAGLALCLAVVFLLSLLATIYLHDVFMESL